MPSHPQIAVRAVDGSLRVVWDELKGGKRRVVADTAVFDAAIGTRFAREEIVPPGSAYPVVASTDDGFVLGWTDTSRVPSAIVLQRLP